MTLWLVHYSGRGAIAIDKRGVARTVDLLQVLATCDAVDYGLYTVLWDGLGGVSASHVDLCPQIEEVAPCAPNVFASLALLPVDGLVSGS
jgi:hypothetical protein